MSACRTEELFDDAVGSQLCMLFGCDANLRQQFLSMLSMGRRPVAHLWDRLTKASGGSRLSDIARDRMLSFENQFTG